MENFKVGQYPGKTKVATKEEIIEKLEQTYRKKNIQMLGFYSSDLDCIIDDPAFMLVPIDERMLNRSHGVFDSMAITKFRFFRLTQHLQRFENSAKKVGIQMPMSIDQIKEIMMDLASFSYKKLYEQNNQADLESTVLNIRIWLSSGRGDFGIYSNDKKPIFYACTFIPTTPYDKLKEGVKEFTVTLGQHEIENIQQAKSISYLENAIIANASKSKGGYLGIKVDENGYLLEASIASIGMILKNKEFVSPPADKIIEGTTLKKCMQFLEKELIPQGYIKSAERKYFDLQYVYDNVQEFILFGGDKIIPVLQLNDKQINDGQKGPICQMIQEWFKNQKQDLGDELVDVSFLKNEKDNN
ncbi:hypothetical protein ABPG74_014671 [Tetrahymena malaccensis]